MQNKDITTAITVTCGRCYKTMVRTESDQDNNGQPTYLFECMTKQCYPKSIIITDIRKQESK